MGNFRMALAVLLSAVAASSCGRSARIEGVLADAPKSGVIVKMLDVNHYEALDTAMTDDRGRFRYKAAMKPGQPEFIYLFYRDTKIASLLLQAGDKVEVVSDTLGTYSVTGSDETLKLMGVERDEAEFNDRLSSMAAQLADVEDSSPAAAQLQCLV